MKKFGLFLIVVFVSLFTVDGIAQHALAPDSQDFSIIPKPKIIVPEIGRFPLHKVKTIVYNTDSLKSEALMLQQFLAKSGIRTNISQNNKNSSEPTIQLLQQQIGNGQSGTLGSYDLKIDGNKILIQSSSTTGIFYGIQTLKQLNTTAGFVNAVSIKDTPAFAWRGYMVDVGRNYQSVELLKQQIDVMASYKLNVFHMHLTEDIAWRLASKAFPQLNAPENMERNKGMYYTENELKDLIAYCKERHILFLPEIDMPGHSKAFTRAMKMDMQTDSGLIIVKKILKEFFETYDLQYIHIGADEVKITKKDFLPEIGAYLKSLNKMVIGWEPGGNFDASTIRQLWIDEAGLTGGKTKIKYIDSRHLYLNHMDPLESVVTIFNRQLADVNQGNTEALGATICLWPDRIVAKQEDAISMNAVYPAMLAFAERSWRGNGYKGWVANMDLNGEQALADFVEFENRLLKHKTKYFKKLSFPYQKQANLTWNLYGPFENDGDLSRKFDPEKPDFELKRKIPTQTALGGTIILRHWWAPKIKGVLANPKENTTWYASQKIWSDTNTSKNFWIGFNNFSRSQATDTPKEGTWDNHHSEVWINGAIVPPPKWTNAGQKGNLEKPLIDEGYEFRQPVELKLKKGWNQVLIKAPIGSFTAKSWNNPEKWMFTFIEVK